MCFADILDFGVSIWNEDGMIKKKPVYTNKDKGMYYVSGKEFPFTFTPQFDLK